ncbi:MAG TPA: Gfo/Idh/MocA family oxidoreductase [Bryobacteraceae bacterium]|nr:Gfo/Idh/MocA family oxidoreductase [Bryobacteraceae bacterium]
MQRRYFLASTAAAAAASAAPARSANDTIRVACVGVRGQGGSHIRAYSAMKNVEIAAICDVDESIRNKRIGEIEASGHKKPQGYNDLRKLLEDKSIDAISIATPNHWHTLQTIWAVQAGKDVYVEKPCSHNMFEAKQIVAAARKYNRVVQHGVNARSSAGLIEAKKQLESGIIGDLYMTRGLCFKWRDTIGKAKVEPVPAGVDYDLWTGPAPKREFTKNRFHYNWHWFWDTGNGDFGNQGIHEVDISRWLLGVKYPTRITALGGKFMFDDDQETPNTMNIAYEFNDHGKKKMMVFDLRHWMSNHEAGIGEGGKKKDSNTIGNTVFGSKGYMAIEGYNAYKTFLGREQEPGPARNEGGSNWQNFIDVLRTGNRGIQNNDIEEGAISTTLMHLGNISYRLGRSIEFDEKTYSCPRDAEANKMFTRQYRAPFVVPAKV